MLASHLPRISRGGVLSFVVDNIGFIFCGAYFGQNPQPKPWDHGGVLWTNVRQHWTGSERLSKAANVKCQPLWCRSKSCLLLLQPTALFTLPSSWSFIKMFLSESRVLLLHPFYNALSFFRWAFLGELVCQFEQFLHPAGTHRLLFLHKKGRERVHIST